MNPGRDAPRQGAMTERHKDVDAYIAKCSEAAAPLLKAARELIHKTLPGASEGMQYGAPVFFNGNGAAVIYLFGSKKHANFGFLKSAEMDDPDGLLRGSGKPSKHIRLHPDEPLDEETLVGFMRQCESMTP